MCNARSRRLRTRPAPQPAQCRPRYREEAQRSCAWRSSDPKSMSALRRGHGDVAYRSNPSQAKRLWHWPRLESSSHRLRLARDDGEVGTRGLIRLGLALFPIPERAEGDTKASRKLLLRKTKRAAHHLDLRDALEVHGPLRR